MTKDGAVERCDGTTTPPPPGTCPPIQENTECDDLLRAVAGGDRAAFGSLYPLLAPKVFGLTRWVLRDPAQAEEVTQEVLLEVWLTAARFDSDRGRATTWALTIAYRRAVDRIRSEQAASARTLYVGAASLDTTHDEVAAQAIRRLECLRVRDCLPALTAVQHQAITLAYYRGHTYAEVASILGIPVATAKTRIRDAIIRLRKCLGNEVPAGSED